MREHIISILIPMLIGLWATFSGQPRPRLATACFVAAAGLLVWTAATWEPIRQPIVEAWSNITIFPLSSIATVCLFVGVILLSYWAVTRESFRNRFVLVTQSLIKRKHRFPLHERISIGDDVVQVKDGLKRGMWDMYLQVANLGPTDSFLIQLVTVQPVDPPVSVLWWPIRWENSTAEEMKILKDNTRRLYFCRTDLVGETHTNPTGQWKPARIWFFTPIEEKEMFISLQGVKRSEDLMNLRLDMTLRITFLSNGEHYNIKLTLGFYGNMVPRIVSFQPI